MDFRNLGLEVADITAPLVLQLHQLRQISSCQLTSIHKGPLDVRKRVATR